MLTTVPSATNISASRASNQSAIVVTSALAAGKTNRTMIACASTATSIDRWHLILLYSRVHWVPRRRLLAT